jgi:hypothetical protein
MSLEEERTQITLEAFNEFCSKVARHDWYYQYSDDRRAYQAGSTSWSNISRTAKLYPEAKEALELYQMYNETARTAEDSEALKEAVDEIRATIAP